MDRPTDDEVIAREAVEEWLGADATMSALLAMNSSGLVLLAPPQPP
jgi:hypothetical protein